jgi:3-deoxy-D-manno-octulosonic-acid transferase
MEADLAVWVKYEFWLNHLEEIHRRKTPLWIWNASFRPGQFLFKPWAKAWLKAVSHSSAIAVQYEEQAKLIKPYHDHVYVLGDARAYQTRERLKHIHIDPQWLAWSQSRPCIVVGSSWPTEEQLIQQFWESFPELSYKWNWIIVPHETNRKPTFTCQFLSQGLPASGENKLWVDQTGHLRGLYTLAKLAIVGGGFGTGLHNVYEPLAAGAPVMCGPITDKFPEAALFEEQGFLSRVDQRQWCVALCEWMVRSDELSRKGEQAKIHLNGKAQSYSEELSRFLKAY